MCQVPKHNKQLFPDNENVKYKNMCPTELFELLSDENVMNLLVEESIKYACFTNLPYFAIPKDKMKCFFVSYCCLSTILIQVNDFWDSRPVMNNKTLSQ